MKDDLYAKEGGKREMCAVHGRITNFRIKDKVMHWL